MAKSRIKRLPGERASEAAMRLTAEERKKMAKKRRQEEDEEVEVPAATSGRAPAAPRISITITPQLRKKLRLAAALADMEEGDWARTVLVTAARRTVEKVYGEDIARGATKRVGDE